MQHWLLYYEIVATDCLQAVCAASTEMQALSYTSDVLEICADDLYALRCSSEQRAQTIASERRVPYLVARIQRKEETAQRKESAH